MPLSSSPRPSSTPTTGELAPLRSSGARGVALRHTATGVLVVLHGEVDCVDGPALAAVRGLLTRWRAHPVVDASAVTFIDATGLRAVLSLATAGSELLVLAPSPAFCHLLDLLHLVGSGIRAVPAGAGSSPPGPGCSTDLPAGSVLVCDHGTSARSTPPAPVPAS